MEAILKGEGERGKEEERKSAQEKSRARDCQRVKELENAFTFV